MLGFAEVAEERGMIGDEVSGAVMEGLDGGDDWGEAAFLGIEVFPLGLFESELFFEAAKADEGHSIVMSVALGKGCSGDETVFENG